MGMVWGYLKRWGLPVLRQFNQAVPVLVLLGVVFLLIAIWWLGPQWTWRERQPLGELAMRVSASVVVLVVPLLIWAWRVRNRYQRLQVERQHEAAVQADPCLPYIEAQERALDRSLGNLLNNIERRRSVSAAVVSGARRRKCRQDQPDHAFQPELRLVPCDQGWGQGSSGRATGLSGGLVDWRRSSFD